jgi:HSP20 family protein
MDEDKDVFAELAKVKSDPKPIKIEAENEEEPEEEKEEADGQLTVDVFQDKDHIVIQSPVAGVKEEDLEVHITNESVSVRGTRERNDTVDDKNFFYQECFWGSFSRSIILPEEVDADRSSAALKNGVLTVKMPKLNRQKVRKVRVKTS